MTSKCSWELRLSAPLLYPVYVEWFYAKFGDEKAITCDAVFAYNGLGDMMGNSSPEATSYPTGIDIVWCSLLEKKWYVAEIDFSDADLEIVKTLFTKGYDGYDSCSWDEKKAHVESYKKLNVCCLPGGEIHIYFSGNQRTVCLNTVFHGKETHQMDDIIVHGLRFNRSESSRYWDNVSEFYDENLYEGKYRKELDELKAEDSPFYEILKNYRENKNVPVGLWTDYYRRYDYKIQIAYENEKGTVPQLEDARFSNGEKYSRKMLVNPKNVIQTPSPIKTLDFYWSVGKQFYYCSMFFNEEETFSLFKKAFEENKGADEALLLVKVSKYNNYFEIFLNVGKSSYRFEKVEINVSTSVGLKGSREYIYSNCDYSHKNEFVGF